MRILFVTADDSPLSHELAALGHDVTVVPPSARACAGAIVRHRPEVAYVRTSALRAPAVSAILRVPYVLELDRIVDPDPRLSVMARGARTIVATSEEIGRFAVGGLGARDASIVAPGIELEELPLIDRSTAKERLHLQADLRMVTMIDELDADLPLDVLAEAHRKLTGTALLVIGDGPKASFVQAMRAATRPSSPVLFLGPQSKAECTLAIGAAHACVSLRAGRLDYAACGRRQVTFAGDAPELLDSLYPDDTLALQVVERTPAALRTALETAIERDAAAPLTREDVDHARDLLSWTHAARQLAQVLEDALGPVGSA